MAISSYSELQDAIRSWTDRNTGKESTYVALFEAFINRNLRIRETTATATLTTSSGAAALPTDFLQVISVRRSGDPVNVLTELEDEEFRARFGNFESGVPSYYMISGSNIYVGDVDDTTSFVLQYYQKIPALETNGTNWLLASHPDAYLFGSLVELEADSQDAEAAALWKQRRDEVVREIQMSGQFYRGPAPAVRVQGVTP